MEKTNKTPIIALLVIAIVGLVGGTFAYFTSQTQFENRFQTKPFSTQVSEVFESPNDWTPGTETPKTITAKNTGDVDVAVRVSYTESWTPSQTGETLSGTITLGEAPNTTTEQVAIINFDNTSDWTKEGNYYYYNKKLSKNQTTSSFIKSVTFNPNATSDLSCTETTDATTNTKTKTCTSSGKGYDGATYTLTISVETIQFDAYKEVWAPTLNISES